MSEMETALTKPRLFSDKQLMKLFLPLIVEQLLESLMGLVNSIMVASVGESAVSGVSLVEMVMLLLISLFAALATGGAVIVGQYLGKKQENQAGEAANQLIWFAGVAGLVIMALIYLLKGFILHGLFGTITEEVYGHANTYLIIVGASVPFLALYNAGAAIFRTMGNSRLPMNIMLVMNLVNIAGNALLVYGLDMGTTGIAIPTLICRIGAAVCIVVLVSNPKNLLSLKKTLRHKFDGKLIKQMMRIGVPYGLENGMFYIGRLLILSLVSTFGTAAIAANSVGSTIASLQALPGMAIGLGMSVVISRCVGAGEYTQAKYYTKKIMGIIFLAQVVSSIVSLALFPSILSIYHFSPEAELWATRIVWSHAIVMMLIWPFGNALPTVFRAAGDAKFPMIVSMITMMGCRILFAYVLVYWFHMDMFATWIAVYCDWLIKGALFIWRYISGKWTKFQAIQ
ncbi:MATE family efflux transporter [Paenibacillus sp. VTT E-133280]|uniref:MATE family efflux transporter n=1 Tax=Paenibacillus sp. VTT E-133280 TaxID=1986222 RepID=UPI000BA1327D|nr:MATE family efflux transporter [Paenibacillus sp. VTT E-133280]OZQ68397.1 MATE family efflux transporter [Paenibacillus sp. VTT E-133280]